MTWQEALRERLIANYTKAANRLADEMIARLEAERIEAELKKALAMYEGWRFMLPTPPGA